MNSLATINQYKIEFVRHLKFVFHLPIFASTIFIMVVTACACAPAPHITLTPTSGLSSSTFSIAGTGFGNRAALAITWDSSTSGMPTNQSAAPNGSFTINVTVPAAASMGSHTVAVNNTTALFSVTASPINTVTPTPVPSGLILLSDNFNDNSRNVNVWSVSILGYPSGDANVGVAETNGQLQITPATNAIGYNGYLSVNSYDLTNKAVLTQVVQAGIGTFTSTVFVVGIDALNSVTFEVKNGILNFRKTISGVDTTLNSISYSATTHTWWRIRELSGTIYFETSPDGITWVQRAQTPDPFPLGAVKVNLWAGTSGSVATPGIAIFDNLDLPPPTGSTPVPTATPTPTPTVTPTPTTAPPTNTPTPGATPTPTNTPFPTPTNTPIPTSTPSPPPSGLIPLVDNFNDNSRNINLWSLGELNDSSPDPLVSVNETLGQLQVTPRSNVTTAAYNGYISVNTYDLTNKAALVQVVQPSAAGTHAQTQLHIGIDTLHTARIVVERSTIYFQYVNGGAYTDTGTPLYYPTCACPWWQIRSAGTFLNWETSPDGLTWTTRGSITTPFPITAIRAAIDAGTYDTVPTPSSAIFDNFNVPAPVGTTVRIDSGAAAGHVDANANSWLADTYAIDGTAYDRGSTFFIANTADQRLYQSERYGVTSYTIPVGNGVYTVRLYFSEKYVTGSNQRVFSVNVQGQAFLQNLDIYALSGASTALVEQTTASVTSGQMVIGFVPNIQNTTIDAIELLQQTGAGQPTSTPVPTSTPTPTPTIPALTNTPTATPTIVPLTATPSPLATCSAGQLQTLINNATPGTTVVSPACITREYITINKALTLDGQSNSQIRGSDVWSGWTAIGNNWISTLTVPVFEAYSAPCQPSTPNCNWPESVFRDGIPLAQVAVGTAPLSGQFALDSSRHVIIHDTPTSHMLEVTTRPRWLDSQASNITIKNFTFMHAANRVQQGAIGNGASFNGWTIQDSQLYYAHGSNISIGGATTGIQVLRNTIAYSGYEGIDGTGVTGALVQGNTIYGNNRLGVSTDFGAGGVKLTAMTNLTLDANILYGNLGPALWCDIGCVGTVYSNNRIHDNQGNGIMEEISTNGHITGNVLWNISGAQPIYISSSAGTEVDNNTLAYSSGGLQLWVVNRGDRPPNAGTGYYAHDNIIIQSVNDTNTMVWADDGVISITAASANNHSLNNSFWYPIAEDGMSRFVWGSNYLSTISGFAATAGGTGSVYLTTAQKNTALANAMIP